MKDSDKKSTFNNKEKITKEDVMGNELAPPETLTKRQFEEKHSNDYRTDYISDKDRVRYSTAFRTLAIYTIFLVLILTD